MRQKISNKKISGLSAKLMAAIFSLVLLGGLSSCDKFELPEAGSQPDLTPPSADFSYAPNDADPLQINFSNLSVESTDFVWDFGDGNTSSEATPSNMYTAFGDYTVTLTASDKLNQVDVMTKTISVIEPDNKFEPVIENPGFDIEGDDSYRNHWRNGDLGEVMQITSSPIHEGVKAAKFPSGGDRIAYQLITVQANKEYTLSFYYTMKTSPAGDLTVRMLAGHVTDPAQVEAKTINSVTVNDQTDANTFVKGTLVFNSGDNTEVAIHVNNSAVECRIDTFSIVENE